MEEKGQGQGQPQPQPSSNTTTAQATHRTTGMSQQPRGVGSSKLSSYAERIAALKSSLAKPPVAIADSSNPQRDNSNDFITNVTLPAAPQPHYDNQQAVRESPPVKPPAPGVESAGSSSDDLTLRLLQIKQKLNASRQQPPITSTVINNNTNTAIKPSSNAPSPVTSLLATRRIITNNESSTSPVTVREAIPQVDNQHINYAKTLPESAPNNNIPVAVLSATSPSSTTATVVATGTRKTRLSALVNRSASAMQSEPTTAPSEITTPVPNPVINHSDQEKTTGKSHANSSLNSNPNPKNHGPVKVIAYDFNAAYPNAFRTSDFTRMSTAGRQSTTTTKCSPAQPTEHQRISTIASRAAGPATPPIVALRPNAYVAQLSTVIESQQQAASSSSSSGRNSRSSRVSSYATGSHRISTIQRPNFNPTRATEAKSPATSDYAQDIFARLTEHLQSQLDTIAAASDTADSDTRTSVIFNQVWLGNEVGSGVRMSTFRPSTENIQGQRFSTTQNIGLTAGRLSNTLRNSLDIRPSLERRSSHIQPCRPTLVSTFGVPVVASAIPIPWRLSTSANGERMSVIDALHSEATPYDPVNDIVASNDLSVTEKRSLLKDLRRRKSVADNAALHSSMASLIGEVKLKVKQRYQEPVDGSGTAFSSIPAAGQPKTAPFRPSATIIPSSPPTLLHGSGGSITGAGTSTSVTSGTVVSGGIMPVFIQGSIMSEMKLKLQQRNANRKDKEVAVEAQGAFVAAPILVAPSVKWTPRVSSATPVGEIKTIKTVIQPKVKSTPPLLSLMDEMKQKLKARQVVY